MSDPIMHNFITEFVEEDLASGRYTSVCTRFPPEPNAYPHIGHAKAMFISHSVAQQYGGTFNLRFDDTNPLKEEQEFVDKILEDIRWLGFAWAGEVKYGSSYFHETYAAAEEMIRNGDAYVDELTPAEMREYRGTLTTPGKHSPYRDRPMEESLDLFRRMKAGEFADGRMVLRAKIDMASPNMNMRDPTLYRIRHVSHHQTGAEWCIYPMYDMAHPIQDALEHITHSLCSKEYEIHRPLYDWVLAHATLPARPRQIEFARLNLPYTVTSKRKLRALVEGGYVDSWDDPRLPTLCAMRRKGYTPEAILDFIARVGVAKADSMADWALLEHCVREDLSGRATRVMGVTQPLKLVIDTYPTDKTELFTVENNPEVPEMGSRQVAFSREVWIEQEDFMLEPPGKFFRLAPGREVRLKGAYIIKCESVEQDADGNVTVVHCSYDPDSYTGGATAGRKVKGTLHWVSVEDGLPVALRHFAHLINDDQGDDELDMGGDETSGSNDFLHKLNPHSLQVLLGFVEPAVKDAAVGTRFQFIREGYYNVDTTSTPDALVFNRIVPLKDSWANMKKAGTT